jgi:hypothetical protein
VLRATGRPCQRPIGLGPTSLTEIEAGNRVPDPRPLGRCGGLVPLVGSMARLGSLFAWLLTTNTSPARRTHVRNGFRVVQCLLLSGSARLASRGEPPSESIGDMTLGF